ncbi:MAG: 3-oxoadipate enol-lactonase [Rhodospirillaceae bacterium]|nr:3-oxoadipate enol-lactonase [Rhodospirillaceae bacterium]MCY4310046.1 3-oxoadipate enol-lactonase [Rhodospirillaceae bacterium]
MTEGITFADIDDIAVHYRVDGPEHAPKLVFSNSLGTDFRTWDGVVGRLADRYRMLRYDTRGHGLSGCPDGAYSIERLGEDLAGLMDAVGFDRAVICGLSVGGVTAQQLHKAHPDKVAALILCDTNAKIGDAAMWQERIDGALGDGGIEALAPAILERWFSAGYQAKYPTDLDGWRNMLVRTPGIGYAGVCHALKEGDLRDHCINIMLPTLVVCGAEDGATTPEAVQALANAIPAARYLEIPDAGHLPCIEQPGVLADAIDAFMKENSSE